MTHIRQDSPGRAIGPLKKPILVKHIKLTRHCPPSLRRNSNLPSQQASGRILNALDYVLRDSDWRARAFPAHSLALTNICTSVELSGMVLYSGQVRKEALRKVEATKFPCPLLPGRSEKESWCDHRTRGECHNLADKHFTSRVAKGEDKQLTSIARHDFMSSMTEAVISEVL